MVKTEIAANQLERERERGGGGGRGAWGGGLDDWADLIGVKYKITGRHHSRHQTTFKTDRDI